MLGVLLLSTQAGDIDKIVYAERLAIMRVFGIATLVNIVLSLLLSSTIATRCGGFRPPRSVYAAGRERVRRYRIFRHVRMRPATCRLPCVK